MMNIGDSICIQNRFSTVVLEWNYNLEVGIFPDKIMSVYETCSSKSSYSVLY
jgi:hypothetical protein